MIERAAKRVLFKQPTFSSNCKSMWKRRSLEITETSTIIIAFISQNLFLNNDLILSFNAGKYVLKLLIGI